MDSRDNAFKRILDILSENISNETNVIFSVYSYYVKNKRHRYSYISEFVEKKSKIDESFCDFLLDNIDYLIAFLKSDKDIEENINKYHNEKLGKLQRLELSELIEKLDKLYDHVCLEEKRIEFSKNRRNEIINSSVFKINQAMERFENVYTKKTEDLNTNMITIIGVFSAIIFVFFGGLSNMISSLSSICSADNRNDVLIGIFIIGLIMFNVVFLLLYSISKITDRNLGRIISHKFYSDHKLRYYWEVNRIHGKSGYFISNEYYYSYTEGKQFKIKEEEENRLKIATPYDRIESCVQHILNIFVWIHCHLCNTFVGKGIRRFPYVFLYNIIMLIVIVLLLLN